MTPAIRVLVRCDAAEKAGWTIAESAYAAVPRKGEEILVLVNRQDVRTSAYLRVTDVHYFPLVDGDTSAGIPSVILKARPLPGTVF